MFPKYHWEVEGHNESVKYGMSHHENVCRHAGVGLTFAASVAFINLGGILSPLQMIIDMLL
jgi:hypothetical protein